MYPNYSDMHRYLLFLTVFLVFIPSCREPVDEVEIRNREDRLLEKFYITKEEHKRHGPYVRYDSTGRVLLEEANYRHGQLDGAYKLYYPSGRLQEEATYKDGKLEGVRKLYYEGGGLQIEEHYLDGLFEGPYRTYYENGQVDQEGQYVNNEMTGEWKRYYPSGRLMEVVQFEHNEENGPFTEYYENGRLKAEGSYLGGDKEHGLLLLYDSTGTLERKMRCNHGICKTFWLADSTAVLPDTTVNIPDSLLRF